jgi:WD40 repeat protein
LGSYRWRDGHGGFATVAIVPDGSTLISGVRVWDIKSGKQRAELKLDRKSSFRLSPDGKTLAAGRDGQVILWDIAADRQVQILKMPETTVDQAQARRVSAKANPIAKARVDWLAFSPDGRILATGTTARLRRAGPMPPVILWDWRKAKPIVTLKGHVGGLAAIAFTQDGRILATADQDNKLYLWEAGSGKRLQTVAVDQEVCSVAFSAVQGRFASIEVDGSVYLWDFVGGKLVNRKKVGELGDDQIRFKNSVVGFSQDGNTLVFTSRYGFLSIYDIHARRIIARRLCGAASFAFTPDGRSVVTQAWFLRVRFWDLDTGKEHAPEIGHGADIRSFAFSADGKEVFTTAKGEDVRVWNAATGRLKRIIKVKSPGNSGQASISEDRKVLAVLAQQSVELLETNSGKSICEFRAPESAVFTELALAPDGILLATVDTALVPNGRRLVPGGTYSLRVWNVADGRQLHRLAESTEPFGAPSFSPDGKFVAAPSNDGGLSIWQTSTGETVADIKIGGRLNIAVSPNGRLLAVARMKANGETKTAQGAVEIKTASGEVQIREFPSGKLIRTLPLGEIPVRANRVLVNLPVWSQDGKRLALPVAHDTSIWDVSTGNRLRVIRGSNPVAFSRAGNRFAASAAHGVGHVWKLSTTPPRTKGN